MSIFSLTKRKKMKQFSTLAIALGILLLSGCGAGDGNAEQAAKEACDCMRPLSESYESFRKAREKNDTEALQQFVEEMEAANEALSSCAEGIEERYGPLEGEREDRVKAAMQRICPEVIARLNEAENALVQ